MHQLGQGLTPEQISVLIDAYLAAWNEPDGAARLRILERCWDPAGVYVDPTVHLEGRAALSQHIAQVQSSRPGAYLEMVGDVDQHHTVARFLWRVVRPGQSPGRVSTDFGEVGPHGLLVQIAGFFDTQ